MGDDYIAVLEYRKVKDIANIFANELFTTIRKEWNDLVKTCILLIEG